MNRNLFFKVTFLLIFFAATIFGYGSSCVDINFTPYSGAENFIFLQNGLEKIDNLIFPNHVVPKDSENLEQSLQISDKQRWLRKMKSAFFWIPVNASCVVTQHEVFGHGYRIRDLGHKYAKVKSYEMYVFGGMTSFQPTNRLTTSQTITIDIAGLEADAILANRIKLKWLNDNQIDGRQSTLYLLSSLSLTGYAFSVKKKPKQESFSGNDISDYLFNINITYSGSYLSLNKTKYMSLINFIDPFFVYTFLSSAAYNKFLSPISIPMIKMGSVEYLPSIRLALSPFGLQGYFENFFLIHSIPTYLYFKWGKNGANGYYGIGIENQKVFHWKSGSLGFRMDLWRQPNVLFQQGVLSLQEIADLPQGDPVPQLYPMSVLTAQSLGAAFSLIGNFTAAKWPIRVFMELGYKTKGYLPGEALRESPIARGGLSGEF